MNEVLSIDEQTQHKSVVEYLCAICGLQSDRSARLASMTILSDLLRSSHITDGTKHICVQSNIVSHLEDILDLSVSAQSLDGMEIHQLKLALQIFWELSMGDVSVHKTMADSNFLKRILAIIEFENSPLLKYDKEATMFLKEMCERKHLIAQIGDELVKSDIGTLNGLNRDCAEYATLSSSLSSARECRLYDTSGAEDIDICQEFIKNGHALPSKHKASFGDESWKDILVTTVIFGPYFWAQIGEKAILTCKKIEMMLEKEELEPCLASIGTHVAVKHSQTIFRGRILNNHGNFISVMAVDYGMVMTVAEDMIYKLSASLSLLHYKAQAQLCCLSGVCPTLLDRNIQQISIGILSNLAMSNMYLGSLLFDLHVFTTLETTLFCPVPCLVIQSLNLMNNLINNSQLANKIPSDKIRKWLLEICDNITEQNISEELKERTAFLALTCLSSLLFKHRQQRKKFYLEQGIDIILKLISKYHKPSPVYKRALKVLKNYLTTSTNVKILPVQKNQDENLSNGSRKSDIW